MAVMELTILSEAYNQQFINRFNYISSGTPASVSLSFALVSAAGAIFDNTLVPPAYPANTLLRAISGLVSSECQLTVCEARDVYSVTDFYTAPLVQAFNGTGSSNAAPTLAVGFRTGRVRADIRRGTKRFSPPAANFGTGAGAINTSDARIVAAVNAMTAVLSYDDEGNTITFTPAIVGKNKVALPDTNPVRYTYRYFPTEQEQLAKVATGFTWEPYQTLRTQVSRQYGRGR